MNKNRYKNIKYKLTYIKTTLITLFVCLLFVKGYVPLEETGENMFHIQVNGQYVGTLGDRQSAEDLLLEARREIALKSDELVFMDNETYDQIEIGKDRLKWELNFLKPEDNIMITTYEGEILGVVLPDKVTLRVAEAENAVKGDTATSALKNAVLETGWTVKVPLFIETDEEIIVSTIDGKYCGRA